MNDTVIELMAEGASKTEVAAALEICWDTLARWQNPESDQYIATFSEAIKRGEQLSQAWWEREGRTSLRDKDFSYTGWYMNMKNRFGWADKQDHTHGMSNDLRSLLGKISGQDTGLPNGNSE